VGAVILAAKECFLLADASKLGHATLSSLAKLDEIDLLFWAGNIPEDFMTGLNAQARAFKTA
jgi:DeoR/GlpR family transcriptional regulator of sugar metabolism